MSEESRLKASACIISVGIEKSGLAHMAGFVCLFGACDEFVVRFSHAQVASG
ncbi:MAG TPA: hypothetical protein VFF30_02095 [Nitrososphaerales archaeon]|nr:hypothetical protein [Nitrososphaerales archaeon]